MKFIKYAATSAATLALVLGWFYYLIATRQIYLLSADQASQVVQLLNDKQEAIAYLVQTLRDCKQGS